ncbi:MAG: hypothetical protein GY950_04635 [bacterium]|nr:hypothetical protein [bacterium]
MKIKAKTIGYVLLSYFQQNFFGTFNTVLALIFLFFGSFIVPAIFKKEGGFAADDFAPWVWFFIILLMMAWGSAIHLKNLVKSNTGALLPHYRKYLLTAVFLVMMFFIAWPMVLLGGIFGQPVLPALALFLSISALLVWGFFSFGDNIMVVAAVLWLGKMLHELLGYRMDLMILGDSPRPVILGSADVFPLLLILSAVTAWVFFFRYVLKIPHRESWENTRHRTNAFAKNYDRVNWLTGKIVKWNLSRLIKGMKGKERKSIFQQARMLQFAFFSPVNVSPTILVIFLAFVMFYLVSYLRIMYGGLLITREFSFILLIFYYIGGGVLATDFLQHRHRLASVWMWAPLNSRKTFTRMTILTYFLVLFKQYVMGSLWVMVVPLFPMIRIHMDMLHILGMGLFLTINIFSFSLLVGDSVRTPDCKGWTISFMFVGIPVIIGANEGIRRLLESPASEGWTIAVMAMVTLVLLGLGYRKWSRTEMNFEGPEALYQY